MTHLNLLPDGSIALVVDRRIFSRAMIKNAAAIVVDRCHVHLDLDDQGAVVVTFHGATDGNEAIRGCAGHFGNLLVAELADAKLDAQARAARNLLLARALDGALPRSEQTENDGTSNQATQQEEVEG